MIDPGSSLDLQYKALCLKAAPEDKESSDFLFQAITLTREQTIAF